MIWTEKGEMFTVFQLIVGILPEYYSKNWTNEGFLKISCNAESETISVNFFVLCYSKIN